MRTSCDTYKHTYISYIHIYIFDQYITWYMHACMHACMHIWPRHDVIFGQDMMWHMNFHIHIWPRNIILKSFASYACRGGSDTGACRSPSKRRHLHSMWTSLAMLWKREADFTCWCASNSDAVSIANVMRRKFIRSTCMNKFIIHVIWKTNWCY